MHGGGMAGTVNLGVSYKTKDDHDSLKVVIGHVNNPIGSGNTDPSMNTQL